MTKEEAKKEYIKIIDEANQKCDEIEKEAKKKGLWSPGLDSNNHLFREVDEEALRKIKELKAQVDE